MNSYGSSSLPLLVLLHLGFQFFKLFHFRFFLLGSLFYLLMELDRVQRLRHSRGLDCLTALNLLLFDSAGRACWLLMEGLEPGESVFDAHGTPTYRPLVLLLLFLKLSSLISGQFLTSAPRKAIMN